MTTARVRDAVLVLGAGIIAALAGTTTAAPVLKPTPFAVGTTWTYRHTTARDAAEPRSGTARAVYGQTVHHGRTLDHIDISYELIPDLLERVYFEWTGTEFRHVARVTTDTLHRAVETIFDRPLNMRRRAEGSGTSIITEDGVTRSILPVRYTATPRGMANITVPAGTFEASRWDLTLRIKELDVLITIYTVGVTDVREDTQTSRPGTQTRYSRELASGPIR